MSFADLLTLPVTIQHPGVKLDGNDDTIVDWSDPDEDEVLGWLTQVAASEVLGNRDAVVSDWKLFLFPDAPIAAGDRVVADGITFEVDGVPLPARTPRALHHIEAQLHAVTG